MNRAILTVGVSACGKTTWAEQYIKENPSFKNVNRDDIRKMVLKDNGLSVDGSNMWGIYIFKKYEETTSSFYDALIQYHIDAGDDIIVSDTNINKKYRDALVNKLTNAGYTVEIKLFDVDYKTLINRDSKRVHTVGAFAIAEQYFKFMDQYGSEFGFHKVDLSLPKKCILVDIDGTLAHMNGKRSPYDWDKVGLDDADEVTKALIRAFPQDVRVIILSGRDGVCRDETIDWLERKDIVYDELHMRPIDDMRSDVIIKNEIIQNHINGKMSPIAWFDDRPSVVRLANVLGIKSIAMGNQHLEF